MGINIWPKQLEPNPVVGTAPKQNFADHTSADAFDARNSYSATRETYGDPFNYLGATPAARSAYELNHNINQSGPEAGTVDPLAAYGGLEGLLAAIRGGSGSAAKTDSPLDWAKWNAEQAANTEAAAVRRRALEGLQGRLASGGYRGNADTLLGLINDQNTAGTTAIQGQYDTGVGNINAGFNTGQEMINSGYGELNQYLNANQINPYANIQQQTGPVNNAMAKYLSAYGVSNDPVNQQVQATQLANQQGADSFNQLQQLMSSNQLANNQSNLGISQMAQNYATTGLGAQRAGYLSNADAARTSAMNRLMDQINEARHGVEQGVSERKNTLEEAILAAGGSTTGTAADVDPVTGRIDSLDDKSPDVAGSATSRAKLAAAAPDKYPNFKAALADMNPKYKFTTMAAAKDKFKSLAKAFGK